MAPEILIAIVLLAAITLYTLFGGADFGAGVWEFNTVLQTSAKERRLMYKAIGPVWETNHVWLIFVLVLMFSAFPTVLAGLSRALWVPLLLGVAGIVFRGASYAFRMASVSSPVNETVWSAVFALASTAAPFFLGACVGAIASGQLPVTHDGRFLGDYLTGWINPLSIFTAFFAVGTCAYLSAIYLAREARLMGDEELTQRWRVRGISTGVWMGVLSMVGLVLMAQQGEKLWTGFTSHAWPAVVVSVLGGVGSIVALWTRKYLAAVVGASITVTAVIWGWGWAQYPVLLPTPSGPDLTSITIHSAKGPDNVLWTMIGGAVFGSSLLVPSLIWLFMIFKANPVEEH